MKKDVIVDLGAGYEELARQKREAYELDRLELLKTQLRAQESPTTMFADIIPDTVTVEKTKARELTVLRDIDFLVKEIEMARAAYENGELTGWQGANLGSMESILSQHAETAIKTSTSSEGKDNNIIGQVASILQSAMFNAASIEDATRKKLY